MKNRLLLYQFIYSFLLLFPCIFLYSNAAQPGIRNAGGAGGFTLLFPEDSIHYQKIQIQKEKISIQLHKGFAIVKGEYWMHSESDEDITMQSGYPINATYRTHKNYDLTEISFDTLYQIRVKIDGTPKETNYKVFSEDNYINHDRNIEYYYGDSKWHTWETTYKANGITKLEVYFILETNNGNVRQGYNGQNYNSFVYVLETGATWKPPIGEGTIVVELMDGLTHKDIIGVSEESIFKLNKEKNRLLYRFENLNPTRENNIAITYHDWDEDFDFKNIISNTTSYFSSIDKFSNTTLDVDNYETIEFESPFNIPDNVSKIFLGGLLGFILIFGLIIFLIGYLIYRFFSRKN